MKSGFITGAESGKGQKHALLVARWNQDITFAMRDAAIVRLKDLGVAEADIDVIYVPGAFELGSTAKAVASTGRVSAVICLGCVIRGDTDHYQFVAGEAARSISQAAYDTGVPVIFGVLTTNTQAQAAERAGATGNKGAEAAETAVEMAGLMKKLAVQ